MAFLLGQMEENMKETGKMENNMGLEKFSLQMDLKELENGRKEKELIGLENENLYILCFNIILLI